MPRKRPPYLKNHFYHFYNRGVDREKIFREDDNYFFVLRKCKEYCQSLSITMIAYCLMPNHYHFLVRQDGDNAARLLTQRVFNSYTKAFNKRYGRSGTLFEGSYQVKLIQEDQHLFHLCRYIHANPVQGGVVEKIEVWPYSNYLEWVGLREGTLFDRDFILEQFNSPKLYEDFVQDYIQNPALLEEKHLGIEVSD